LREEEEDPGKQLKSFKIARDPGSSGKVHSMASSNSSGLWLGELFAEPPPQLIFRSPSSNEKLHSKAHSHDFDLLAKEEKEKGMGHNRVSSTYENFEYGH